MANHKSAKKRTRQTIKKALRNSSLRSQMRSVVRSFREACASGDEKANDLLKSAVSSISRLSSKGLLHKRTASRKISRLSKLSK